MVVLAEWIGSERVRRKRRLILIISREPAPFPSPLPVAGEVNTLIYAPPIRMNRTLDAG